MKIYNGETLVLNFTTIKDDSDNIIAFEDGDGNLVFNQLFLKDATNDATASIRIGDKTVLPAIDIPVVYYQNKDNDQFILNTTAQTYWALADGNNIGYWYDKTSVGGSTNVLDRIFEVTDKVSAQYWCDQANAVEGNTDRYTIAGSPIAHG